MVEIEDVYMALSDVYDPEIRINIVELGLVYNVEIKDKIVDVKMTLTSPNCPASPEIRNNARNAVVSIPGVIEANINVVWEPKWEPDMMSEEAKLDLGYDVFCQDERKF